jgi:hypothetical protein
MRIVSTVVDLRNSFPNYSKLFNVMSYGYSVNRSVLRTCRLRDGIGLGSMSFCWATHISTSVKKVNYEML